MKTIFLSLCLFSALYVSAQNQQYYNWNWKPCNPEDARFISITDKTDSGWAKRDFYLSTKKLQMKGLYKDSALKIKNGWFRYFYSNQILSSQGNFVNGEKDGLWLSYHYNGMMKDSVLYEKGNMRTAIGWYGNGNAADSAVNNADGTGVYVAWFDNGQPSASGRIFKGKKDKKWQYFHKNGNIAAMEEYEQDKLISRVYYDEAGVQLADTTNRNRNAEFKGGEKKWRSFLSSNLEFPPGVKLNNTEKITVVVNATIDEDGNVTDLYVSVPVHPKFDEEALRVFRRSPKWVPSIAHNRRVKYYIRQPLTFGQYDF
jgi:TonB family protein